MVNAGEKMSVIEKNLVLLFCDEICRHRYKTTSPPLQANVRTSCCRWCYISPLRLGFIGFIRLIGFRSRCRSLIYPVLIPSSFTSWGA